MKFNSMPGRWEDVLTLGQIRSYNYILNIWIIFESRCVIDDNKPTKNYIFTFTLLSQAFPDVVVSLYGGSLRLTKSGDSTQINSLIT